MSLRTTGQTRRPAMTLLTESVPDPLGLFFVHPLNRCIQHAAPGEKHLAPGATAVVQETLRKKRLQALSHLFTGSAEMLASFFRDTVFVFVLTGCIFVHGSLLLPGSIIALLVLRRCRCLCSRCWSCCGSGSTRPGGGGGRGAPAGYIDLYINLVAKVTSIGIR